MQYTGALRKNSRLGLDNLRTTGNVVVDARERFARKRNRPISDATLLPPPVSGSLAHATLDAPARTPRSSIAGHVSAKTVRPLVRRLALDDKLAFILIRDGFDTRNCRACILLTAIPVPQDADDDERYVTPYLLRGWRVLFHDPERPGLPVAHSMDADPLTVFWRAVDQLDDAEDRQTIREHYAVNLVLIPDPLK